MQASKAWYTKINTFLCTLSLTWNEYDHNLYFSMEGGHYVIFILYVDNLFLFRNDTKRFDIFQEKLTK